MQCPYGIPSLGFAEFHEITGNLYFEWIANHDYTWLYPSLSMRFNQSWPLGNPRKMITDPWRSKALYWMITSIILHQWPHDGKPVNFDKHTHIKPTQYFQLYVCVYAHTHTRNFFHIFSIMIQLGFTSWSNLNVKDDTIRHSRDWYWFLVYKHH